MADQDDFIRRMREGMEQPPRERFPLAIAPLQARRGTPRNLLILVALAVSIAFCVVVAMVIINLPRTASPAPAATAPTPSAEQLLQIDEVPSLDIPDIPIPAVAVPGPSSAAILHPYQLEMQPDVLVGFYRLAFSRYGWTINKTHTALPSLKPADKGVYTFIVCKQPNRWAPVIFAFRDYDGKGDIPKSGTMQLGVTGLPDKDRCTETG
jgi:hypothetical protein